VRLKLFLLLLSISVLIAWAGMEPDNPVATAEAVTTYEYTTVDTFYWWYSDKQRTEGVNKVLAEINDKASEGWEVDVRLDERYILMRRKARQWQ